MIIKGRNNDYKVMKSKNNEGARLVMQLTGKEQGKLLQCVDGSIENALDSIFFSQRSYSIVAFSVLGDKGSVNNSKVRLNTFEYWLSPQINNWERLGGGSFGDVYSAISLDNQLVALKVFGSEKDWLQELNNTKKLKALNPPQGICLPIDFGTFQDKWIIVYPRGTNKSHLTSMLPVNLLLVSMLNLTQALSWLHDQSLYHGDIKLDNLLFTSNGLSFIDFGLLSKQITPTENIEYVTYRSPEMTMNKITFKTEVLALGVCFYQMFYCNLLLLNGIRLGNDKDKYIPAYQREQLPPKNWSSPFVLSFIELDNLLAGLFSRSFLPIEKPIFISIYQLIKDMLILDNSVRPHAQDVCKRIIKLQGVCCEH